MTYTRMRWALCLATCLCLSGLASSTWAQTAEQAQQQESAWQAAEQAAKQSMKSGPATISLLDQATLELPKDLVYIPQPAANQMLAAMGNNTDQKTLGLVMGLPSPEGTEAGSNSFVVLEFVKEGYISDEDAKKWDVDALLENLRAGTEAGNQQRVQRGFAELEVVGWAEKPRYEASLHHLVWSMLARHKGSTSADNGVNYNTYALGRDGYISLNLVTEEKSLPHDKPYADQLLNALHFNEGKRYSDFNSSTDKVAAYGLAALIGGVAVKKLGLLTLAAAFFAKFAKLILLAGGAVFWGVAKWFGKKKD